jgi:hypothetical protein
MYSLARMEDHDGRRAQLEAEHRAIFFSPDFEPARTRR